MKKITIQTKHPCDVIIESGGLEKLGRHVNTKFISPRKVCVITDSNVGPLYGDVVLESLEKQGFDAFKIMFPAGEHSKNLTTYANILESLAESEITRSDVILGLGGGVVGDLTGFIAGTYMRGVEYVHVPTTVLASIDSSIGGKTAVNSLSGKNLVGLIWQPSLVVTDPNTFDTLPERNLRDGLAEALKSAIISDSGLISYIGTDNYEYVIERCISIKKSLVEVDEMDTGLRQILNYGHTIGHGIEKITSYNVSHGEAVAKGMIGEARACHRLGYSSTDISGELSRILEGLGFDTSLDYDPQVLYEHALKDKKIRDGQINIIVPEVIGKCSLKKLPLEELKEFMEAAVTP